MRNAKAKPSTAWDEASIDAITCARRGCQILQTRPPSVRHQVFYEGRDVCSRACLKQLILTTVGTIFQSQFVQSEPYSHRMPLGLLMLSRNLISREHLNLALSNQRASGQGRIGEWLVATGAIGEESVARAVAAQWGVPILSARVQATDVVGSIPLLLTDAFNSVPVRLVANRILYLAVDGQLHPSLNLAIERMTGFRVEPVVLTTSDYRVLHESAHRQAANGRHFRTHSTTHLCASILSLLDAGESRNVQISVVGRYVWLRILRRGIEESRENIEDVIFICHDMHPQS